MSSSFPAVSNPLTVFAPPNEAFQKLPKDVMEKIKTNLTFNHSKSNSYVFYVNNECWENHTLKISASPSPPRPIFFQLHAYLGNFGKISEDGQHHLHRKNITHDSIISFLENLRKLFLAP